MKKLILGLGIFTLVGFSGVEAAQKDLSATQVSGNHAYMQLASDTESMPTTDENQDQVTTQNGDDQNSDSDKSGEQDSTNQDADQSQHDSNGNDQKMNDGESDYE